MGKTVYGPVPSWRLGRSFGIDLIGATKACSFDCIYCQLGRTLEKTIERKVFIKTETFVHDLDKALSKAEADTITFSGSGEHSLAENFGQALKEVRKKSSLPVAVLTNSSLLYRKKVRKDFAGLDIICAKLDAANQKTLEAVNRPVQGINFELVLDGIKKMRKEFKGKFALQCMFMKENMDSAKEIAELTREIKPDEVQLNTPTRLCAVKALSNEEMNKVKKEFDGLNSFTVYEKEKPEVKDLNADETLLRRPKGSILDDSV